MQQTNSKLDTSTVSFAGTATISAVGQGAKVVLAGGPIDPLEIESGVRIFSAIAFVSSITNTPYGSQDVFFADDSVCSITHCSVFSGNWTATGIQINHGSCVINTKKNTVITFSNGSTAQLPAGSTAFIDSVEDGSTQVVNLSAKQMHICLEKNRGMPLCAGQKIEFGSKQICQKVKPARCYRELSLCSIRSIGP